MLLARVIARLELGGTQLGVLRLSHALGERGIATRVLAGEADAESARLYREVGVPLEVWGGGSDMQYACSSGFAEWLRPRLAAADLVHGHMFGGWWATAEAAAPEVPLAASEHNALQWPGPPRVAEMRRALRRVDAFFAHGPATRATVRDLGLPAARIHAGRSPIEVPAQWAPRVRGWPPPGSPLRPRIVFAGRLHEEKGADILVEAIALLPRPVSCSLLGAGPQEGALRRRVAELGLDDLVEMPGWQPAVERWIERADLVVVPSRYEAWSQTAVTAMAHGVPVVATNVEGLPTTLAGGRGILVPTEEPRALARAIDDVLAGRRNPDLAAARRYAARFTAERVADYYAGTYARMLAAPRRREMQPAAPSRPAGEPLRRAAA